MQVYSELHIKDVKPLDIGEYRCHAMTIGLSSVLSSYAKLIISCK